MVYGLDSTDERWSCRICITIHRKVSPTGRRRCETDPILRVKELGFSLKEIKESTPFPILTLAPNHDVQANGRFPESGTLQSLWKGIAKNYAHLHVFTVRGEPMISRKVGIIIACCRESHNSVL